MMPGPIRWFAHNPIAANLLMILLIVGGALSLPVLNKEFFPDFKLNVVNVSMPYPGQAPARLKSRSVFA